MKNIIFLLLSFTMVACSKDVKEQSIFVSIGNLIQVKNASGENLLDPNVPNCYIHDSIYTFKMDSNGKEQIIQRDIVVSSETILFVLRVSGVPEDLNENPQTYYLRLSPSDVDTLKTTYVHEPGNLYNTHFWYNGELKWTLSDEKPIVIIKP